MTIQRGAIYRKIKPLDREGRLEFLQSVGFTADQAEDFVTDYEINTRALERKPKDDKAFQDMMARLRAKCEGICLIQETDTGL